MNIEGIRSRVKNGPRAVPSADGNFYSEVAQAIQDRADLLEELDRRPMLSNHDAMAMRLVLDDSIASLREKLFDVEKAGEESDYDADDIDWMKVSLASQERLMERLNNL